MLQIYTEPIFLAEKEYVFHVLFREILGLDFVIHTSSVSRQFKIELPNNTKIEFRDAFFSNFSESVGYCDIKNIPTKITYIKDIVPQEVIPVIYGDNSFNEMNAQSIYCGVDIIGSAFYMLSRWEESAIIEKDSYGRFPERLSLAVKYDFISKPIVHLYAELFKAMASSLGYKIISKRKFSKTLTHDIDSMYKWMGYLDYAKTCLGDIFKRGSLSTLKNTMSIRKQQKDPYDTFSELMDASESQGLQSTFYFLNTPQNLKAFSSERGKQVISNIINRKHIIGAHFNGYLEDSLPEIQKDVTLFESIFSNKIAISRQHFLKIQIPSTYILLESAGIEQDSTLYFRNYPGFRTGMCIEHSLFDCNSRKMLQIKELPLTLMDVSLQGAKNQDELIAKVDALLQITKKYEGNFVCLWHNSSFDKYEWKNLISAYNYIVEFK